MKNFKKIIIALSLLMSVQGAFSIEQAIVSEALLERLPEDLKTFEIPQLIRSGTLKDLSEKIFTVAAAAPKWHALINNPDNFLLILNAYPYTTKGLALIDRLRNEPTSLRYVADIKVADNKRITDWEETVKRKLTNGNELFAAATNGNLAQAKELLKNKNLHLNWRSSTGETALIVAARNGNREFVELLLKAGANPNMQDQFATTALDAATSEDIKQLLRHYEAKSRADILRELGQAIKR